MSHLAKLVTRHQLAGARTEPKGFARSWAVKRGPVWWIQ